MPTINTLGGPSRRTEFSYDGSIEDGVVLNHKLRTEVPPELFAAIFRRFAGQTIPGGFSMTKPTAGGLGEWIQENSKDICGRKLTSRHASFIAAVLVNETETTHHLRGNAVHLSFPS